MLQVNFSQRFLAEYAEVKRLLAADVVDRPSFILSIKRDTLSVPTQMISWAGRTSPVWFMTSHDLDLVHWYLNAEPIWTVARQQTMALAERGIQAHDGIHALVGFSDGTEACFSTLWTYPNTYPSVSEDTLEIVGTRGMLRYQSRERTLEVFSPDQAYRTAFVGPATATEIDGHLSGAFVESLDLFVRSIKQSTRPSTAAANSLTSVACQAAMLESARNGGRVIRLGDSAPLHTGH